MCAEFFHKGEHWNHTVLPILRSKLVGSQNCCTMWYILKYVAQLLHSRIILCKQLQLFLSSIPVVVSPSSHGHSYIERVVHATGCCQILCSSVLAVNAVRQNMCGKYMRHQQENMFYMNLAGSRKITKSIYTYVYFTGFIAVWTHMYWEVKAHWLYVGGRRQHSIYNLHYFLPVCEIWIT